MPNPYRPPTDVAEEDLGVDSLESRQELSHRVVVASCFGASVFSGAFAIAHQSWPLVMTTIALSYVGMSYLERTTRRDDD